jgi:hypothetical protein
MPLRRVDEGALLPAVSTVVHRRRTAGNLAPRYATQSASANPARSPGPGDLLALTWAEAQHSKDSKDSKDSKRLSRAIEFCPEAVVRPAR